MTFQNIICLCYCLVSLAALLSYVLFYILVIHSFMALNLGMYIVFWEFVVYHVCIKVYMCPYIQYIHIHNPCVFTLIFSASCTVCEVIITLDRKYYNRTVVIIVHWSCCMSGYPQSGESIMVDVATGGGSKSGEMVCYLCTHWPFFLSWYC